MGGGGGKAAFEVEAFDGGERCDAVGGGGGGVAAEDVEVVGEDVAGGGGPSCVQRGQRLPDVSLRRVLLNRLQRTERAPLRSTLPSKRKHIILHKTRIHLRLQLPPTQPNLRPPLIHPLPLRHTALTTPLLHTNQRHPLQTLEALGVFTPAHHQTLVLLAGDEHDAGVVAAGWL